MAEAATQGFWVLKPELWADQSLEHSPEKLGFDGLGLPSWAKHITSVLMHCAATYTHPAVYYIEFTLIFSMLQVPWHWCQCSPAHASPVRAMHDVWSNTQCLWQQQWPGMANPTLLSMSFLGQCIDPHRWSPSCQLTFWVHQWGLFANTPPVQSLPQLQVVSRLDPQVFTYPQHAPM